MLSSRRARVRAPLSFLIAGCLGAGALAAIQPVTASAATLSSSATPGSSTPSSDAGSSKASDLLNAVPQTNVPQDYVPAGCNNPSLKDGVAQCFADVRTGSDHIVRPQVSAPPSAALGPADIRAAYNLPATGEGRTVAIVDAYGDSHAEADLAAYREYYGLPECTTANGCFRKADQSGGTDYPADDPGWALETALDLDAVSSACPACNILLVQGDSASLDDLGTAVDTAVRLGAKYVSNSYGLPGESASQTAYDHHYDHPGVAVVASTGDTGHVQNWPATNPDVVAAGGTRLTRTEDTARGWTESAWTSGGSGCSLYEARPAYQRGLTTGCDTRATADISAVADPATGLAVYDTVGRDGWLQVGGTSLSAPLITAMYALAGTPVEGTYPVTYPYINASGLTDVTEGSNDACGKVSCTAGAGWDGPTGLGTPVGVSALAFGVHGTLSGRVTDSASGAPLAGAALAVSAATGGREYHVTTDADGTYELPVAVGDYRITATDFGYQENTGSTVSVAENLTTTADLTLVKLPTRTVSGTVKDGSGHGWPLYSRITIDGYPNGAVYTDPYTGKYRVELPEKATYDLHVAPVYPGYRSTDLTVPVGTADVRTDVSPDVDLTACVAPGHAYRGAADFEGWTGSTPEHGWTVVDHGTSGAAWDFADSFLANYTGGTGNWAAADPYGRGGAPEDTELVSPDFSLAGQDVPVLAFYALYAASKDSAADVDLSLDSGATWTTVWHRDTAEYLGHVEVPLPQAANAKHVKVRFHYSGSGLSIWQLDTVTVGSCAAVSGGIVAGKVVDGNTGGAITPATVTDTADRYATATTVATPDDLALADGYYWLFSAPAGRHTYRTAAARYTTSTGTLTTRPDKVNRFDRTLKAGRLAVSSRSVTVSETLGGSGGKRVTFTNRGQAPLHVDLGEQSTGYTSPDGTSTTTSDSSAGAPTLRVKGNYSPGPMSSGPSAAKSTQSDPPATAPTSASTGPWTGIADYPEPVMDNAVGTYQGKVYSVAGVSGIFYGQYLTHSYVHDPSTDAWTPIADLPEVLESPGGAFINGTMYVAGGWARDHASASLYAYHPTTDTWTRLSDLPQAIGMPNVTVLDGSLYVIGGCTGSDCGDSVSTVYRYTPATDTWTRRADYPFTMERGACAGITGEVVCAGGITAVGGGVAPRTGQTYRYSPAADTWTRAADMPQAGWGATASGNDGKLQVVGGIIGVNAVNTAVEYDPVSNTWSNLPNAGSAVFRAGGGCGIYRIGGMTAAHDTATSAEVLPGHDQCDGDDVTWLSADRTSFDLAPGRSTTVTVRADASAVAAAGTYTARLTYSTDAPYAGASVEVTLKVTIPRTWGHLSGTVTDRHTGAPLAGATVLICPAAHAGTTGCDHVAHTVRTDSGGHYDLWLETRPNPLRITASAAGHRPASTVVTLLPGRATTADLSLTAT